MSSEYKIFSDKEHVENRKELYMGSVDIEENNEWVLNDNNKAFIKSNIKYCPALVGLFGELISNAYDNLFRNNNMTFIKVYYDEKTNENIVMNDGIDISLDIFKGHGSESLTEKLYIPEVIFGLFKSSSNFNDNNKRISSGLHGLGAKLCNICSKKFEIVIRNNGKKYTQTWINCMKDKYKPIIEEIKNKKINDITIKFIPEMSLFHIDTFDYVKKIIKKCYDISACSIISGKKINLFYNDNIIKFNNYLEYISMYTTNIIYYNKIHEKLEIGVTINNEDNFNSISFINSINSKGKFVDKIINQICDKYIEIIKNKNKSLNITRHIVKKFLTIFINGLSYDVKFKSQTKDELSTDVEKNGCSLVINDKILKEITNTIDITEKIITLALLKESSIIKLADKKNNKSVIKIAKCDDAHLAGIEPHNCSLIITEGESAKTLADAGISCIKDGRKYYGSYPLRGKLKNTRKNNDNIKKKLDKPLKTNREITELKQLLGLISDTDYSDDKNFNKLRYHSIIIMSDQDNDGLHIKGLIINFIHKSWPQLLERNNFIKCIITPIIIYQYKNKVERFYVEKDFEIWKKNSGIKINKDNTTYCKGLGTLEPNTASYYFNNLDFHMKVYYNNGSKERLDDLMNLAFSVDLSDIRKYWLKNYNKDLTVNYNEKKISYEDFINKELIHFSKYNVDRAIPNIMDGLKISQRKILYYCFKKNLIKKMRVSQLAGYVSAETSYHHGETSLNSAIISLGYNFVGSNNINLIKLYGQGGSRTGSCKGFGKNHAAPRYIYASLNPITKYIFRDFDEKLLEYQYDEEIKIEPKFYLPILPLCLINGESGIGTGWNTQIPKYNINDIINIMDKIIIDKLDPKDLEDPLPFYKGWTGSIIKENDKYYSIGKWEEKEYKNNYIVTVTELPVGKTTYSFKEKLDFLREKKIVNKYYNDSNEAKETIKIVIHLHEKVNNISQLLCLKESIPFNLVLLDENNNIRVFKKIIHIIIYFIKIRFGYYNLRKKSILYEFNEELKRYENKYRLLKEIINDEIDIYKKSKIDIINLLKNRKYDLLKNNKNILTYDYLLNIPLYTFSNEELNNIEKKIIDIKNNINKYNNYTNTTFYIEDIKNFKSIYKDYC